MEFIGTLNLTIQVTVKAKTKKQAIAIFDSLYPHITIENDGSVENIEIIEDNIDLIENDWEVSKDG